MAIYTLQKGQVNAPKIFMTKDKEFIYLEKENEPNKQYRYNLKNCGFERVNHYKTTGRKVTPVKVANITKWFKDCTLVTTEHKFARLFWFNKSHRLLRRYKSPVRYIEYFAKFTPTLTFEKWDAIDIGFSDIDAFLESMEENDGENYRYHSYNIEYNPSDFEKPILRLIKKYNIKLNIKEFAYFMANFDEKRIKIWQTLLEYSHMPQYSELFGCRRVSYSSYQMIDNCLEYNFNHDHPSTIRDAIIETIIDFNLDLKAFIKFLDRMRRVEGVDIEYLFGRRHYYDYLNMQYNLKKGRSVKIEKYPKNFATQFLITQKDFAIMKQSINELNFQRISEKNQHYEYKTQKYSIVVPKKSHEIETEADVLKHCVRSYIQPMCDGKTCILFLRDSKDLDTPLVTIEVKKHTLIQAYGEEDSKPTDEQLKFIKNWAKRNHILLSWCWDV